MTSEYVNPEDEVQHFLDQFEGLNDEQKEALTNDFSNFVEAWVRYRYLPRAKQFIKPRVLSNGNPVTTDASGVTRDLKNTSVGDTLNFIGGVVNVNAANPRQFDIQMSGGGDCMFDFLVSSCFASLAGFTEGQVFTTVSGCTYKGYSTFTGVSTYLNGLSSSATFTVFLCGITSESVTLTPNAVNRYQGLYVYGSGRAHAGITGTMTIAGNGVEFYDVQLPTLTTGTSAANYNVVCHRCNITSLNSTALGGWVTGRWYDCNITNVNSPANTSWEDNVWQTCSLSGFDLSLGTSHKTQRILGCLFPQAGFVKIKGGNGHQVKGNTFYGSGFSPAAAVTFIVNTASVSFNNSVTDNLFAAPPTSGVAIDITGTSATFEGTIDGNTFDYQGGGIANFVRSASTITAIVAVTGNNFGARNDTPTFLETDGGISVSGKFIYSTFGPNTPANFNLNLLTGSSNDLYIGLGTVSGAGASGATISASNADAFVTIGHPADLPNSRAITTGSGVSATDGGAGGPVTLALANLTGNWTQAGVFDISQAGNLVVLKHADFGAGGGAALPNAILSLDETINVSVGAPIGLTGSVTKQLSGASAVDGFGLDYNLVVIGAFADTGIDYGVRSVLTRSTNLGTSADFRNFHAAAAISSGTATVTDRRGLYVANATGAGSLTNQTGIYIESLTKGGTLNMALRALGGHSRHVGSFSIGADATPNASAILDLTNAANLAVLLPQVPTASLPAGVEGLILYDSTAQKTKAYQGGAWVAFGAGGGITTTYEEFVFDTAYPTVGDITEWRQMKFNGGSGTAMSVSVRAQEYGYGTTTVDVQKATDVTPPTAAPTFATMLTSVVTIESSHISLSGVEWLATSGGALTVTALADKDIVQTIFPATASAYGVETTLAFSTP